MTENRLIMILFGATGDLAARKLYPALFKLYKKGQLAEHFAVIGTARRKWTDDHFRKVVKQSIETETTNKQLQNEFTRHFYYQANDVNDSENYEQLKQLADELDERYKTQGNRVFYIALAPQLYPVITHHLKTQKMLTNDGYNRLVIEKPFGSDLTSATELQENLQKSFDEDQIYRIDHYLGKELVANLISLRQNTLLGALWNNQFIDNIQITLAESIGIESRGAYYEKAGVSRDMIQNHALQMLAFIAMPLSSDMDGNAIRQAKRDALKAIQPYQNIDEFTHSVVRGQYSGNRSHGVVPYREENHVADDSTTETFLATKININLPMWEGVPFFVRSGKRLGRKCTVIQIIFKPTHPKSQANVLTIRVQPQPGYALTLGNLEKHQIELKDKLDDTQLAQTPDDYERLIAAVFDGDLTFFAHWDEVKYSWQYIDQLHDYWQQLPRPDFPNYLPGSSGPVESQALVEENNTHWYCPLFSE